MRALTFSVFALLAVPAHAADETIGRAEIVDGETLMLDTHGERVRLFGIDAPDRKQTCEDADGRNYPCGVRAAEYLAALIERDGTVECVERNRDVYDRIVGECAVGSGGETLNAAMVRSGWALDLRESSGGLYAEQEAEAKAGKRGLWAGTFDTPSNWRLSEQHGSGSARPGIDETLTTSATRPMPGRRADCRIKGDIDGTDRVYHRPDQATYADTKIDEVMGERWFCSEREALTAGWHAARE